MLAENPQGRTTGPTVLVVEDDVLQRLTIAEELRSAGFSVVEATNADEALTILNGTTQIDLVLTDVVMPGSIDGIGLAVALRGGWPRLKVVVTSAQAPVWPSPELADAFIGKPYDPARVVGRIRDLLGNDTK